MRLSMLDDEHAAFYTVGQVAAMLDVQQAFQRRIDEHRVVSPQRSAGGQRRYSRHDIVRVQRVAVMVSEGMTLPAIRRIIELEHQLAEVTRERDELARQLAELRSGQRGVNQRQAGLPAAGPPGPPGPLPPPDSHGPDGPAHSVR